MPAPIGKMVIYRIADGQRFERWPIDARAMLASGDYAAEPPTSDQAPASDDATAEQTPVVENVVPAGTESVGLASSTPAEHPLGVPVVASTSETAGPAQTVTLPAGRTPKQEK